MLTNLLFGILSFLEIFNVTHISLFDIFVKHIVVPNWIVGLFDSKHTSLFDTFGGHIKEWMKKGDYWEIIFHDFEGANYQTG